MGNSMRGAVAFTADGAERHLRFTTNAMVRYQDAAGETLMEAVAGLQERPDDMRRLRRLFWAGLASGGLTEDDAGDLMDDLGVERAGELIVEAFRSAFPRSQAAEAAAEGNDRPGKPAAAKASSTPS